MGANVLDGYPQACDAKENSKTCMHTCDFMRLLLFLLDSSVMEFMNDKKIFVNVVF